MSPQNLGHTRQRSAVSPVGAGMTVEKGAAEVVGRATVHVQAFWLLMWLVNNIGITMANKHAFSVAGFHYVLVASAWHMICNWLGTIVYFFFSSNERAVITGSQWIPLILFSVVFSLNISVGNYSSMLVSVKFNQVMRSLVPAIVMVVGINVFKKTYSSDRKLAIVPIMLGVMLACFGEMTLNALSFMVTALCVVLAALKVVLSGEMLTGSNKLPPLDLLSRMAPLAFVQMTVIAFLDGEVADMLDNWETLSSGWALWIVAMTGVGSFSLNLCSLMANKVTSPLTLSIMANIKQVLLIVNSTIYFGTPCTVLNKVGILIVIIASFRYSMLSIKEGNRSAKVVEDGEPATGPILPK